jgi:hypothetical protein
MFQNSDAEVPAYSVLTTTFFQAKIISKSAFVNAERKLKQALPSSVDRSTTQEHTTFSSSSTLLHSTKNSVGVSEGEEPFGAP